MGLFTKKEKETRVMSSSVVGLPIQEVKLKEYAIDVCASYIARIFSQSKFVVNDKRWSYRLNVKPNENQSGAEFWREVIYRLFKEGEALVVLSDNNMLLLADYFDENEYSLYQNIYRNVTVGDYTFKKIFYSNEVLHFRLKNEKLNLFTASIYKDYETLVSSMMTSTKLSNQLRFKFNVPRFEMTKEEWDVYDALVDEISKKIDGDAIVGIPDNNSFEYQEINTPTKDALSVEMLDTAIWSFIDKVATIVGIPPVLLHGEVAGIEDAKNMFFMNCLEPLNQLIEDEINAKIFKEDNYSPDNSVDIMGANKPDAFSMAEQVDKLISSGTFNRNEIRTLLGFDTVDGLDEFVITKNYETNSLKGGEEDEEVL